MCLFVKAGTQPKCLSCMELLLFDNRVKQDGSRETVCEGKISCDTRGISDIVISITVMSILIPEMPHYTVSPCVTRYLTFTHSLTAASYLTWLSNSNRPTSDKPLG